MNEYVNKRAYETPAAGSKKYILPSTFTLSECYNKLVKVTNR